jgi:2-dehydropantoate 2-reductase
MTLRTLIVGAGAIGGYFGARMIESGADVTFLVRPRRAAQLAADGLNIRSPGGNATLRAPATVTASTIAGPFDAVILSCKAFDLPSAMEAMAPAVGPDTKILPLLNGMSHLDTLSARFGEQAVLGGLAQISTTLEADGTVRQFGDMQAIVLGERTGPATPTAQALAQALAPAGGRLSEIILQEMWEKWVFITTLACTTCLMRTTIGDVVAAGASEIPLGLVDECAAIATLAGYPPRPASLERLRAVATTPRSPLTASMLRDIERGGPVEVEHVVGNLLARGTPGASPLLRVAYLQLNAYEARRTRLG